MKVRFAFLLSVMLGLLPVCGQPQMPGLRMQQPAATGLLFDNLVNTPVMGLSVRKLRTAYAGNCWRVVRASDGHTNDFAFVSNLVDTNGIASFCSGTIGYLTYWYDQSTGGANSCGTVLGATNTALLVFRGGTNCIATNGLPCALCNPNTLSVLHFTNSLSTVALTCFATWNPGTSGIGVLYATSQASGYEMLLWSNPNMLLVDQAGCGSSISTTGTGNNACMICLGIFNDGTSAVAVNNAASATGGLPSQSGTPWLCNTTDLGVSNAGMQVMEVVSFSVNANSDWTTYKSSANGFFHIY